MEQFVFGRLKLVAVLRFSMLVLMSIIFRGILHLRGPFWLLLCMPSPFTSILHFLALHILTIHLILCSGRDLLLLNTEVGDEETQVRTKQLLHVEEPTPEDDGNSSCQPNNSSTYLIQCVLKYLIMLQVIRNQL